MVAQRQTEPRDALTGERLRPDTLRYTLHTDRLDNPRGVRQGDAPETSPQPLRLHTAQVETSGGPGGGLGGHTFSRQFVAYLSSVRPAVIEQAWREARYWWASSYGRFRVRARFIRAYGVAHGDGAWRVAVAVASGYMTWEQVAAETGHSATWIQRKVTLAQTFAQPDRSRVVRPIER